MGFLKFDFVQTLGHSERFHLVAATGWLELGNWKEAAIELDNLPSEFQNHADVLQVRWAIFSAAKDWEKAVVIGRMLSEMVPEDSFGYVHQAYALHELNRTQEAWNVLHQVVDKFPKEYIIRYNLACYACRLGNREEALKLVAKAIRLGGQKDVRAMALADPDLAPLKAEIENMG